MARHSTRILPEGVGTSVSSPGARTVLLITHSGRSRVPEMPLTFRSPVNDMVLVELFTVATTYIALRFGKNGSRPSFSEVGWMKTERGISGSAVAALVAPAEAGLAGAGFPSSPRRFAKPRQTRNQRSESG